ncbi:unnamed protein product [Penicillium roqueforti FM164]|uniref:Genomic scaffold, ProqFM164S01 n=1 Tax=Penicillium roqueforti (strain FM164) TaxID=1365484 RepID=W6QHB7_PENRF|nr:unnamed protein product [Penicillium roqueforti FM164]
MDASGFNATSWLPRRENGSSGRLNGSLAEAILQHMHIRSEGSIKYVASWSPPASMGC